MPSRRSSAASRWRLFTEHGLGMLLCLLAVATFGFGLGGFSVQYAALPPTPGVTPSAGVDWTIPVYKTFQLFLLNSGTEDDPTHPSNSYLTMARLFAITFLVTISLAAIVNAVGRFCSFLRQVTQRGHVVICGVGQIGLQILDDLLK